MSLSTKRRAAALRNLLLADVHFARPQIDRLSAADGFIGQSVQFMGCDEERDEEVVWSMRGHSGPGVYISCSEYPEEGAVFVALSFGEAIRIAGPTMTNPSATRDKETTDDEPETNCRST